MSYTQLIGIQPRQYARTITSITPQGGLQYDSKNVREIQFKIPAQSYLDSGASYLSFDVVINATPNVAVTAANQFFIGLDGPSTSLFTKAVTLNSEGQVVTELSEFAELSLHRLRQKGFDYQASMGANGMGHTSFFETVEYTNAGVPYIGNVTTGLLSNAASAATVNGLSNKPVVNLFSNAATAGVPLQSVKANLIIPLEYISPGICPLQNFPVPLHLMGKKSHAVEIKLTMATFEQAFFVAGATLDINNSNLSYSLENVQLIMEHINLGPDVDIQVQKLADTGALEYMFNDFSVSKDSGLKSTTSQYVSQSTKFTMSLNSIATQLRPSVPGLAFPSVSCTVRGNVTSYQTKTGAFYYPSQPIKLGLLALNGSAYAELSKCTKAVSAINGHAYMGPRYNSVTGGQFEMAVDMNVKALSGAASDESLTISGKSTTNGSSAVEVRITRAPESGDPAVTYDLAMTNIFSTSNVCKIQNGVLYPIERV